MTSLEVLFTPAEFGALRQRDLREGVCVVFDVLRATSSMVTALANGAEAIMPVEEVAEALAARQRKPKVLLAGERDGLRIPAALTGSIDFDLGNSPREFAPQIVRGKTIVITTTNGTRALRACTSARRVLAASFLNLTATSKFIENLGPSELLLVCSGTLEQAAYEDVLGAGALVDMLWGKYPKDAISDSAYMAVRLFRLEQDNLVSAVASSRNARRLLNRAELHDDVAFCSQRDRFPLVAELGRDGLVRKQADFPTRGRENVL
jgi:2-phosphosulfolactate phosphatase